MAKVRRYKEEILKAVLEVPEEALPKVLQFITLVCEQFRIPKRKLNGSSKTTHARTRRLLASSKTNWAQALRAEREDRL